MKADLTQSLEKYLLAIFEIVKTNKAARVKDVALYLKIGAPATSDAVKTLAERKYINYVPYGIITLTKKGQKYAVEKIKRHGIIADFLSGVLYINSKDADKKADDIEYSMPADVLERFTLFLEFMEKCSCKEPKWKKSYKYFLENGKMQEKCMQCADGKISCCGNCKG